MNEKCLLEHLPERLSARVLRDWISIKALKTFDSACCERAAVRTELHEAIRSDELCLYVNVLRSLESTAYWKKWDSRASARTVSISSSKMENVEYVSAVSEYVTRFGKHVDTLYVYDEICPQSSRLIDLVTIHCHNLTEVCYSGNSRAALHQILRVSQNVQELHLNSKFCDDPSDSFADIRLPKLHTLICRSMFGIADCIRTGNCITKLDVSESNMTTAEYVQLPLLMPQLRALCIASSPINDQAVSVISRCCPHIIHLDMYDCTVVTDVGVESLVANLKGLQSLCLNNCPQLTCRSLVHIYTHASETLRTLHMCSVVETTSPATIARDNEILHKLFDTCQNIRRLGWVDGKEDDSYTLPPSIRNLTTLQLGHSAICDKNMAVIADHCPHLLNLSLVLFNELEYAEYTCAGLKRIAFGCPQLLVLAISLEIYDDEDKHPFVGLTMDLWRALRPQLTIYEESIPRFEFDALELPI